MQHHRNNQCHMNEKMKDTSMKQGGKRTGVPEEEIDSIAEEW